MSYLTQFTGGSVPGAVVPGSGAVWGTYINMSGKEYLQFGTLRTYASQYAQFAANLPSACWFDVPTSNTSWVQSSYSGGTRMFYLNGNYHFIMTQVTQAQRGTSLASAPTADNMASRYPTDAIIFNNLMVVACDQGGNTTYIISSDGSAAAWIERKATSMYTSAQFDFIAASSSLAVVMSNNTTNDGYQSTKVQTSTNGTTWNNATPSVLDLTNARFFWSPVANAFFLITTSGVMYSTTDGYTLTSRTAPSGMPVSISAPGPYGMPSTFGASSSTITLVSVGQSKLLKITGLTTYEIVDVSSVLGVTNATVRMEYDGTKFWMSYVTGNTPFAYSTDGTNWTKLFNVYNASYLTSSTTISGFSYANSKYILIAAYRPFDVTASITTSPPVPALVGGATSTNWDSGGHIKPYWQLT